LYGNNIKVGDAVTAFFNRISGDKYSLFDKQFEEAAVGSSITIELEMISM
jgi:sulfate adenylyltransferase subunit 1